MFCCYLLFQSNTCWACGAGSRSNTAEESGVTVCEAIPAGSYISQQTGDVLHCAAGYYGALTGVLLL